MLRIKTCFRVSAFFGFWFVFGNLHNMLRHKAFPFLLVHNNDFEAFGHGCWTEMLSRLSLF